MCLESAALPDRRQTARSAALIGNVILTVDSQRKSRIVIEEKGGHMVIKDVHQRIRFFSSSQRCSGSKLWKIGAHAGSCCL